MITLASSASVPGRPAVAGRVLCGVVGALPVAALSGVDAGALAAIAFSGALVVDARRPTAIATLPMARRALPALLVAGAGLVVLAVLVAIDRLGRTDALPGLAIGAAAAVASALATSRLGRRATTRILLLGTAAEAARLRRTLDDVAERRFVVVARVDALAQLERAQRASGAELIVHTDHVPRPLVLEHLATVLRDRPVRAIHLDELCEEALGVVALPSVDAAWLAELADPWRSARAGRGSRALDVVLATALLLPALVLLLPLLPLLLLDRAGGPFFRQARVGRHGRPFSILKLRTMRGAGADWSEPGDPRVTRIGALLRRTHVDELPQLWNVVRGDMGLVGPRPEQVAITERLTAEIPLFPYRTLVRPGITGWARVRCGYARTTRESALKLANDLYYLKHRGLLLDLAIVLETLRLAVVEKQFEVRPPAAAYALGTDRTPERGAAMAEAAPLHLPPSTPTVVTRGAA